MTPHPPPAVEAPEEFSPEITEIVRDVQTSYNVDALLSNELMGMSLRERYQVEEEIHGVNCRAVQETPDLLELALNEFDLQLNERKAGFFPPKPVLRNVTCMTGRRVPLPHERSCYLNHRDVRIRFLRCELFRIDAAVERFVSFFELMHDVFGEYVADRQPLISDFTPAEERELRKSRNQILPFRDRSGRQIFVGVGNCNQHIELKLRCKIFMYLHWAVSEDVETQKKGLVIAAWFFDEADDHTWENHLFKKMDEKMLEYQRRQYASLPVRIASWQHYYMDTIYFRFFYKLYVFFHDKRYLSIHKAHFGSQMELRYKLNSYGIPNDLLPLSHKGILKFEHHHNFLNMQKAKLRSNPNDPNFREIVVCPRENDVVFRKGTAFKNNRGNDLYRELLRDRSLVYFQGDRATRREISLSIAQEIEDKNGAFLEWKNKMWLVIRNQEDIRKKIAASFKQYNRDKNKERDQLVKTIQSAVAIGNALDDEEECVGFCDPTRNPNAALEGRKEYAFLNDQPAKMSMPQEAGRNQCFGMCFAPTELKEPESESLF
mmetsp:Transcript_18565/g.42889  ORF Transcript_18565/g.42889 Transcript_18565/m.42889 type:complete len:546 (+) Transcript_18565:513-2150(+)